MHRKSAAMKIDGVDEGYHVAVVVGDVLDLHYF